MLFIFIDESSYMHQLTLQKTVRCLVMNMFRLAFQGSCSSSWPASLPTMETLVLHQLHCKRFSNFRFTSPTFGIGQHCATLTSLQPPSLFCALPVCLSDPPCCSCTETQEITRGVTEVWTLSSQRSVT